MLWRTDACLSAVFLFFFCSSAARSFLCNVGQKHMCVTHAQCTCAHLTTHENKTEHQTDHMTETKTANTAAHIRHKVANTHVWSSVHVVVFYVLSGTSCVGISTQHVFTYTHARASGVSFCQPFEVIAPTSDQISKCSHGAPKQ